MGPPILSMERYGGYMNIALFQCKQMASFETSGKNCSVVLIGPETTMAHSQTGPAGP